MLSRRFPFWLAFLLLCGGSTRGIAADHATAMADKFQDWGLEVLARIERDFWLADERLFAEHGPQEPTNAPRQPAFMWSVGVQLSALTAAAQLDPQEFEQPLRDYVNEIDRYWCESHGVEGYDVLPGARQPDRYYDDNAWIVLALCEIHERTTAKSDKQLYLERAKRTFRFVVSGEDDLLGGGIYWRENKRASKNTCSNAPAIVGALRLYQATHSDEYLATALRLNAWTCDKLQDSDGLFFDNVRIDGSVDRRKYSYNSALMIRANCLLFQIEKDPKYLVEAQRIAEAARNNWIVATDQGVRDAGRFAHLLLEGFLALYQLDHDQRWLDCATGVMTFVHDKLSDDQGRYPTRWDEPRRDRRRHYELLDQASVARGYLVVAAAWRNVNLFARPPADD